MSVFYLASPIDNPSDGVSSYRQTLIRMLESQGHVLFDPSTAWKGPSPASDPKLSVSVQHANDAVIETLDGVIALIPPQCTTIGTIYEIALASSLKKFVAVWAPLIKPSVVLNSLGVHYSSDIQEVSDVIAQHFAS